MAKQSMTEYYLNMGNSNSPKHAYAPVSFHLPAAASSSTQAKEVVLTHTMPRDEIVTLNLSKQKVTIQKLVQMLSPINTEKIEFLNLSNNPLGKLEDQAKLVEAIKAHPQLTKLNLSNTGISSTTDVMILLSAIGSEKIEFLDLSNNKLHNILPLSAVIEMCPNLRFINLKNTSAGIGELSSLLAYRKDLGITITDEYKKQMHQNTSCKLTIEFIEKCVNSRKEAYKKTYLENLSQELLSCLNRIDPLKDLTISYLVEELSDDFLLGKGYLEEFESSQ
jgi:hypothetical protein